jgi:cytochrome c oxidase subunit 2
MLTHYFNVLCDAPESWQINLQDPATPAVDGMLFFHNYLTLFLIIIGIFVMWMLAFVIKNFNETINSIPQKFLLF